MYDEFTRSELKGLMQINQVSLTSSNEFEPCFKLRRPKQNVFVHSLLLPMTKQENNNLILLPKGGKLITEAFI